MSVMFSVAVPGNGNPQRNHELHLIRNSSAWNGLLVADEKSSGVNGN
jgi:hypothetical protein